MLLLLHKREALALGAAAGDYKLQKDYKPRLAQGGSRQFVDRSVKWGLFKRDSRDRIPNHAGIREGKRAVRGELEIGLEN